MTSETLLILLGRGRCKGIFEPVGLSMSDVNDPIIFAAPGRAELGCCSFVLSSLRKIVGSPSCRIQWLPKASPTSHLQIVGRCCTQLKGLLPVHGRGTSHRVECRRMGRVHAGRLSSGGLCHPFQKPHSVCNEIVLYFPFDASASHCPRPLNGKSCC